MQWLNEADFNTGIAGEDSNRAALKDFYDALLLLIEALHVINAQSRKGNRKSEFPIKDEPGNPWLIVRNFCELYSREYIRRELWCFVDAGISHAFNNPQELLPGPVLEWYEEVVALVESAFILCEVECQ